MFLNFFPTFHQHEWLVSIFKVLFHCLSLELHLCITQVSSRAVCSDPLNIACESLTSGRDVKCPRRVLYVPLLNTCSVYSSLECLSCSVSLCWSSDWLCQYKLCYTLNSKIECNKPCGCFILLVAYVSLKLGLLLCGYYRVVLGRVHSPTLALDFLIDLCGV